jgi:Tfp pilus assembly protein PilO
MSRREQVLFAAAAALVAFFLAYAFAILPAYERYQHQDVLIKEKSRRAAMLEKELQRADSLDQQYREIHARMARDRGRDDSPQTLFADLQALAGPMGVQVTGVDPLPPKEYTFYQEHAVLIDIEADLEALVHFLYEIEHAQNRLQVQRLVVAPVEPGSPALRSQIQVATRILHEEAKQQ